MQSILRMFIHLHTHSHYSLLDGLPKIDELIAKALEYKMPALALTDHGVMYGAIEFYKKAKEAGIKPIIGVEVYVAPHSHLNKRGRIDEERYHLILLAKNQTGYKNLIKLTTLSHLEGYYYKPRIDFDLLKNLSEGLIALTACLNGELPKIILNGDLKRAEEFVKRYESLFGKGNFYLEIQHHPNLRGQEMVNQEIIRLSRRLRVPIVATNDVHYLNPEDDQAHDILLCLQTKKKKEDENRLCYLGEDYSLRPSSRMSRDFQNLPEAIKNTLEVAERCNLDLKLGKVKLPYFEVPNKKNPDEYLRKLSELGLVKRYGSPNPGREISERLKYELSVIQKTGFASYFLIVQDFVNWAKDKGIVVGPGRGSVAGSLVSYLLNITNIDPFKYGLIFERFLNPERISLPDIDLDFADHRRDEVIDYVRKKYGENHVAQIITFGTMAARAAVRDCGRVLGLPYNFCDQIAKLIPPLTSLDKALDISGDLKETYEKDPEAKRLIDTAKKLEGVARHASTHACGIVITQESLDEHLPRQYVSSSDKTIISQYAMDSIANLGLLKMDLLGLKNLTILEKAVKIIERTQGLKLKLDNIPLDDKKTFKLLLVGETTGVFQLESEGIKRYLKQLKPTHFEDIIAMVALYRPGPMELIPDYIAGKHKKKEIAYLHPKLKPILEKTYGVAVYQEQLLQIAKDLANFTLGEADILRKAVAKKIHCLLKEQKVKFLEGCLKNRIDEKTAEKIFAFIEPFAGYGFNLAHAASYALIAYETAYLKAHFPVEFMASLLTSDQRDMERIATLVQECENMGIKVFPPDINESFGGFTVIASDKTSSFSNIHGEEKKERETGIPKACIRFGLKAIKNVGHHIVEVITREREKNGLYKTIEDFLSRVQDKDLNRKSLESLIKSGASDKFGERKLLLGNINLLLNLAKAVQKETQNGQVSLFGILPQDKISRLQLEPQESASKEERLTWERELLGLYVSEHPFQEFLSHLQDVITPLNKLGRYLGGGIVKVAGLITNIKKILTRNGEPMLFVKMEDTKGSAETLVFPRLLKETATLWQENKVVLIEGKLSSKEKEVKILANKVWGIDQNNLKDVLKEVSSSNSKREFR